MEKIYTISDLMQAIEDSGRNYDTDRIMAAYKVAEEAHKDLDKCESERGDQLSALAEGM